MAIKTLLLQRESGIKKDNEMFIAGLDGMKHAFSTEVYEILHDSRPVHENNTHEGIPFYNPGSHVVLIARLPNDRSIIGDHPTHGMKTCCSIFASHAEFVAVPELCLKLVLNDKDNKSSVRKNGYL